MSRRSSAEGQMCEICARRMLAGEIASVMDHQGRRIVRGAICPLCRRRAIAAGWTTSSEVATRVDVPAGGPPSD